MLKLSSYLLILLMGAMLENPQNADTPLITTKAEYSDGAAVSVRYQAVGWGNLTTPGRSVQGMEGGYGLDMATITSNVQLTLGPTKLDPGSYGIGFIQQQEQWYVAITQGDTMISNLPILMREEPELTNYLTFILRPGMTDRDFIFTCLYGNLTTSLRWTISGVPVRQMEPLNTTNTNVIIPDLGETQLEKWNPQKMGMGAGLQNNRLNPSINTNDAYTNNAYKNIGNATNTPNLRPKAGSGAFRRILERQNQEEEIEK